MLVLLQRVKYAEVAVANKTIAAIKQGLLVFLGIEKNDSESQAIYLIQRIIHYRIFADSENKINLSVQQIQGEILVVPQFTLAADTNKGLRPSFSPAATPIEGEKLFNFFIQQLQNNYAKVCQGKFGADMQISLCNDGPMTFLLRK